MKTLRFLCAGLFFCVFAHTAAAKCSAHHRAVHPSLPLPSPVQFSIVLYPGSLKGNMVRIGKAQGWRTVVWNAPEDYRWIGRSVIYATSLQAALNKVLVNYPLQAQFYRGNHVLAIVPRNLP